MDGAFAVGWGLHFTMMNEIRLPIPNLSECLEFIYFFLVISSATSLFRHPKIWISAGMFFVLQAEETQLIDVLWVDGDDRVARLGIC